MNVQCERRAIDPVVEARKKELSENGLSKNAIKRLLKAPIVEARRQYQRQRDKEKRAEKRRALAATRREHAEREIASSHDDIDNSNECLHRTQRRAAARIEFEKKCSDNFVIVIDCGWDHLHSQRSHKSLAQQILYCYGAMRRAVRPCHLMLTGVSDQMKEQLLKCNLASWQCVSCYSEDYMDLIRSEECSDSAVQRLKSKELIYLTSDAEETMQTTSDAHAYVIGGIVDRNRFKGITYEKAKQQGVRTMKLPIKEHIELCATPVLTVNHVVDILLTESSTRSWEATLERVLPERKRRKATDEVVTGTDAAQVTATDDVHLSICC